MQPLSIEIIHETNAAGARAALFDFDGTLSLIRSGWEQVMVPMMVELLAELRSGESDAQLETVVRDFVARLTGKQTIYQMIELAEQIRRRGGQARDPLDYKRMYHDRLWQRIRGRVEGLRAGTIDPASLLVPGSTQLLAALRERDLRLFLASGTDEVYMADEAQLLNVARFFDGGIRGAVDDYQSFSKRLVITQVTNEMQLAPGELLSFGDGFVEIENTKEAGGVAVGVATDEPGCRIVNPWKRQRLIQAGADVIIPNFEESGALLRYLFEPHEQLAISGLRPKPPETPAAG